MAKTIWKYPLRTIDGQDLSMPIGAEILTVQIQYDIPCLWAVVDDARPKEDRHIEIYGTGHEMRPLTSRKYIGTYQLTFEGLVFHVFERI